MREAPKSPTSPEELANERAKLIAAGDATEMEVHMAENGVHDDLVAAVANVLSGQNPGIPTY